MAVEDVFATTGRGTLATRRIMKGIVEVGDTIEIVGLRETTVGTAAKYIEPPYFPRFGRHAN